MRINNVKLLKSTNLLAKDLKDFDLKKIFKNVLSENNGAFCKTFLKDFSRLCKKFKKVDLIEMYENSLKNSDEKLFFGELDTGIMKRSNDNEKVKEFNKWLVNALKKFDIIFESLNFMFYENETGNEIEKKDIFFFCIFFNKHNSAEACWELIDHPISYALFAAKIYKHFSEKAGKLCHRNLSYL